ncbi:unnamed protein product [Blepharisma stoltei]|uniref:Uncharacterized protein n=1 Tax=Blepharisma stoltei TaxID=1481888 RepID=A0AAU9IMS8_9CILI|nr:unnamed protein product [Blepharisma stoltei]
MGCCQGINFEKSEFAIPSYEAAMIMREKRKSLDEEFEDISLISRRVTQGDVEYFDEKTECNSKFIMDSFMTNTFTMRNDFESAFLVSDSVFLSSRDLISFIKQDIGKLSA